ncbi:MAG: MFS transporter [Thermoleophilia bacterium]|nr:MFS transporter [Thermoleophilia bacterium]
MAVGVGLGLAVGWNIANVGAIAEPLAHAYAVGLAAVGLLTTALFVVHMAMQVPAGMAVDRFGPRETGILAVAVLAVANGLAALAPELALGLVARALAGVGTGLGFVAGSDYVRAAGGTATAQGLYGGAGVGGGGFALAIVPLLENVAGWRAPFLSAAALALAMLVALLLAPATGRVARARASLRSVLGDRVLYRFAAIHTASFGLSTVVANWVVTLLERAGAASETAGALGAFTLAAGLVTRPLGGWLVRRHARHARAIVGWSLAAGAGATAVLALPAPLPVLALACAILGLAAGFAFAPAFAGAQRARPDAPGAAIGLVNVWAALAIVVGTPLVGLTFGLPGDGRLGFAAVAVLWAASLLALPRRAQLAG